MVEGAVETAARFVEEFRAGMQRGDVTAVFDSGVAAAEMELIPDRDYPEWQIFRGREGFSAFIRAWTEPFDQWDLEVTEMNYAGNGRVVSVLRQWASGHGSSVPVELRFGTVLDVNADQVARVTLYTDPADLPAEP